MAPKPRLAAAARRRARGRRLVPFALALLPLAPSACATNDHTPTPPAPPPVIIGVSLGLTGSLGSFSAPLKSAVAVAEGQINAIGGVLGRPVRFDVEDDGSDEGDGVRKVVQGFLDEHAVAVIGPVGSGQVVAAHQLTYNAHVIMISPSATSTDLTTFEPAQDRYFFRTAPPDDLQGRAVGLFALRGPPSGTPLDAGVSDGGPKPPGAPFCTKMAIVNIKNSYGQAMGDVITSYMQAKGGTITTRVVVDVARADNYKTEVDTVVHSNPQCQALIAYDDVADGWMVDLTPRLAELPPSFIVIGTDGVYTQGFIDNGRANKADPNSPTVAEGVYGTNPDTNPPTTEFNDFKNLYNAYFPLNGQDPEPYTANMFDAAILAYLAIVQAGIQTGTVPDGPSIRDALYAVSQNGNAYGPAQLVDAVKAIKAGTKIKYKGASGDVTLDKNGNTVSDYIVWKVVNGKYSNPPIDRIKASELTQ